MGVPPAKLHEKWWIRQGGAGASACQLFGGVFRTGRASPVAGDLDAELLGWLREAYEIC
jgi:hypothetical protein